MKVSFLISAAAFLRLGPAASERGWRSDPDYAERTVQRLLEGRSEDPATRVLDGRPVASLAAMRGEFHGSSVDEVVGSIGRFFGEPPPRVEIEGVEYAVGRTLAVLSPLPG
jgi:hypothetical protein